MPDYVVAGMMIIENVRYDLVICSMGNVAPRIRIIVGMPMATEGMIVRNLVRSMASSRVYRMLRSCTRDSTRVYREGMVAQGGWLCMAGQRKSGRWTSVTRVCLSDHANSLFGRNRIAGCSC